MAEKRVSPDKIGDDIMRGVRQRPKFIAQQVTKELVLNGRLPHLEQLGDHLARYGKGFSQLLSIAGDQRQAEPTSQFSPRLMDGFSVFQDERHSQPSPAMQ